MSCPAAGRLSCLLTACQAWCVAFSRTQGYINTPRAIQRLCSGAHSWPLTRRRMAFTPESVSAPQRPGRIHSPGTRSQTRTGTCRRRGGRPVSRPSRQSPHLCCTPDGMLTLSSSCGPQLGLSPWQVALSGHAPWEGWRTVCLSSVSKGRVGGQTSCALSRAFASQGQRAEGRGKDGVLTHIPTRLRLTAVGMVLSVLWTCVGLLDIFSNRPRKV